MEVCARTIRPRVDIHPGAKGGSSDSSPGRLGEIVPTHDTSGQIIHSQQATLAPGAPSPWDGVMDTRILGIHDTATAAAAPHGGVISRSRLRALGINRDEVRLQLRQRRWVAHGRWTIATHTGDLGDLARRWRAVWEVGAGIAALDGPTALQHAGLERWNDDLVHVFVPHTASSTPVDGVVVHKVRSRPPSLLAPGELPVVRPAPAAVRAVHWAVSDRQAALVLIMPVQQRLCTGAQLLEATSLVRGRTRRALIAGVACDVALGVQALGELDFAALCRRYRLPEPDRQVVRNGPRGRVYLDVRWDCGLVVGIDGAGHRWGLAVTDDNLRQNSVTLHGDTVLRIDVLGLRIAEEQFMGQVVAAHTRLAGLRLAG